MKISKFGLLASYALAAAVAISPAAHGQEVDDEVIVTATKRQQTLQEAPLAVTVTDSLTIERSNITDVLDLQSVVPSLRVNQLQSSQNTNFIIRGFGNGANNAGIEPSVGVFVDGVYRSRSSARIGDLPKLERIEVLPGPQSTLFGKNASAGVISIVTAKPSFDKEGYAQLGVSNYGGFNANAYYSNALNETVAFSLGGNYQTRGGYGEPIDTSLDDINDRNRYNLRGQILVEPSENASFRLIADYATLDENCCLTTVFTQSPITGILAGINSGPALPDVSDPFHYRGWQNRNSVNELTDWGVSLQADFGTDLFDITSISAYRDNDSFYDSDADYGLADLLPSVVSDQRTKTFTQELRLTSNANDSRIDWMLGGFLFIEDVQQNAGLTYGPDLRAYLDAQVTALTGTPGFLGLIELANGIAPGTFFAAGNGGNINQQTTDERFTQDNTSYSIFGTVDFNVSDRLTLTGGLNFTSDEKDVTGFTINNDVFSSIDLAGAEGANFFTFSVFANGQAPIPGVLPGGIPSFMAAFGLPFTPANVQAVATNPASAAAFAGYDANVRAFAAATAASPSNPLLGLTALQFQPPFLAFPNSVEDGRSADEDVTFTLRGSYEVTSNLNVYASYATGFKSSSWNLSRDSRPAAGDQAAIVAANLDQTNQSYGTRFAGPEEVKSIEFGLKTKFDQGSLEVALFDMTLTGVQTNAFVGTAFVLTNAGELSHRGAEFTLKYRPVDSFIIDAAGTFLDAKFDEYQNAVGPIPGVPIDRTGEKPDNVSDISLSIGATYEHEFANGRSGYLRADYQYESDAILGRNLTPDALAVRATANGFSTVTAQFPGYETRNQNIFNASAGLKFGNGVGLQVWARNLFNDRYASTLFPGVAQEGQIFGYPSPPRMYGMNIRYDF